MMIFIFNKRLSGDRILRIRISNLKVGDRFLDMKTKKKYVITDHKIIGRGFGLCSYRQIGSHTQGGGGCYGKMETLNNVKLIR